MSVEVSVHEAKTHLSRLLEQVLAGEEVVITRSGRRVARLTPVEPAPFQRRLGTAEGEVVISNDFDDPLPDDILDAFER